MVLAVDGKTVRGARAGDGTAPHLLACLDHGSGTVLAQLEVGAKTNEITRFAGLLGRPGDLTGVLVTADALHAQREHATWLAERGAHYLVTVKGNQPGLLRQLRALPWKDVPAGHVQDSRGHGRIEKRIVKAVTVAAGIAFPHAAQAIQVTRQTRRPAAGSGGPRPARASYEQPAPRMGSARSPAPGCSPRSVTTDHASPMLKVSMPTPEPHQSPAPAARPPPSCTATLTAGAWPPSATSGRSLPSAPHTHGARSALRQA